jgi:site-specific DNA recombinase
VCVRIAERHGLEVIGRYEDAALSGGTTRRQGYQRMLEGARRREFDVIVAEDVSRLWRLMAEQAPRLAELRDLDVQVITQDFDTRHESADILGAVNGAMSEHYRQEIGRRTRRGLEGRARAGKPTGGKAHGYIAARDSATGDREIHPEQAKVVLRIFEDYANGLSPRAIAAALTRRRALARINAQARGAAPKTLDVVRHCRRSAARHRDPEQPDLHRQVELQPLPVGALGIGLEPTALPGESPERVDRSH